MKTITIILALVASGLFIFVCTNFIDLEFPLLDTIESYESGSAVSSDISGIQSSSSFEFDSGSWGTVIVLGQKIIMLLVVVTFLAWVFMMLKNIKMTKKT
jgi:hypothetical protein